MSILLSGEKLKKLVRDGIIEKGKEENVEGIKYDFRLGDRFLKTEHQGPANISDFTVKEKENYSIEPGETIFVLSCEKLNLPNNIKAELSNKRKLAHLGIFVLGGFCVDPLYEGYLIFGMYNLSNRPFLLEENKKLIAAQFYELVDDETMNLPKPKSLYDFPDDLIEISKGMRPISLQGIEKKITDLTLQLTNLEKDFRDRDDWFKNMKENMDTLMGSIGELRSSLETEKSIRESECSGLKELFEKDVQSFNELAASLKAEKMIRTKEYENNKNLIEEQRKDIGALVTATSTEKIMRKAALWLIGVIIAGALGISFINISKQISFVGGEKSLKTGTHVEGSSKTVDE